MDITKIESANDLLEIRDRIEDPTVRIYTEQEKFLMFKVYNQINKLYGYGSIKDNCSGCIEIKVVPQMKRWFKAWDEKNKQPELTLTELRAKHPNIKSNSVKGFLEKLENYGKE